MEDLKQKIIKEIEKIPDCKYYEDRNMQDVPLSSKRNGVLFKFKYTIPCGTQKNKNIIIGIELPEKDYPRLPPHFIHLKKDEFTENIIEKMGKYHEVYNNEKAWIVFSRPPQDIWDDLDDEKKNLNTFFESHLRRFWNSV